MSNTSASYASAYEATNPAADAGVDLHSFQRRRMLHVVLPLFLVSVIAFLDRVNIAYAGMTMKDTLSWLSPEVFGLGAGIFFVGYVLFEVPASLLAARFNAMHWVARIMFSWGLVCVLMTTMSTELEFYVYRFLLGLCEASLYPVIYSLLIPKWFLPQERAKAISLMLTSLLISTIIGAPLAGVLLELNVFGFHGWQTLFIVEAVPALIFAFIFAKWMKATPQEASWVTPEEKAFIARELEREEANKVKVKKYTTLQALTDPKVLRLCLIYFLWVIGFWGFSFWMPQVLKQLSGWSPSLVGWSIVFPMTAALIVQVWCGHSSAKTGEKRWHTAVPLFVGAAGLAATPFSPNPLVSLFFICCSAIGVYAGMGVWWTMPTTFLSGAAAAGAMGLINSSGNVGGWVGPYMLGFLNQTTGSFTIGYLVMGGCMFLAGLLILTLKKENATNDTTPHNASTM